MIYYVSGSVWQCGRDVKPNVAELAARGSARRCEVGLPGIVAGASEPRKIDVDGEGCGRWMPLEYRMCASQLIDQGADIAATTNTFWNGSFFAQRVTYAPETSLQNGCRHAKALSSIFRSGRRLGRVSRAMARA
eukprot:CAMPEP_0181172212 /NCGR_PEP_ID=MMETSP1096-20121128/2330_1 /TAXON_ID=156174 ORGANISM="Chrysochromulina ericina, Strain CCMP281" /NCGR_SAMPLE_ID=MMETSP1096 /ASSEMBLY_ACC=CAM_ASM_000453 /LENGTH=133 /DNA_ID=CAMNT_0023259927 /DNA_START=14 /DNA_END=415 /DNA_ORIENTATION=+